MTNVKVKKPLPVNAQILAWARDWAGRSLEESAKAAGVKPEKIEAWEDNTTSQSPTVRQARLLAKCYGRPFLEFFLSAPPQLPESVLIPDFRLYRGARDPSKLRELRRVQEWAETQRINALDLYAEIGESPANFPKKLFSSRSEDIEERSALARKTLGFPIEEQLALNSNERDQIPNILRKKIESIGTLTLKLTTLGNLNTRGFCIAEFPLPVIVFGKESPRAQAFTLMHEFAHLILKTSAVSGVLTRTGGAREARQIEEWCNNFASAFLMPIAALEGIHPKPARPARVISDSFLRRISNTFSVSDHAALVRLVSLKHVHPDYYWNIKKPEFDAFEANYTGGGRPAYYGTRYKNKLGNLYTTLVLQAWRLGRITNHNAAEFMGIENLNHLRDIRAEYQA